VISVSIYSIHHVCFISIDSQSLLKFLKIQKNSFLKDGNLTNIQISPGCHSPLDLVFVLETISH
jgi:hypothetical protein